MFKYIIHRQSKTNPQLFTGKFGKQQTIIYQKKLRDRSQNLADHPARETGRDNIQAGYYSYFEGAHTIYYQIRDADVDVIDVLHQSMDLAHHV